MLVPDSQGLEQHYDGDPEDDAAVLPEANLVPAAARSVRDDRVAAAVTRNDVNIVSLSIAGHKSLTSRIGDECQRMIFQFEFQRPDTGVLVDVFNSTCNGCSLC